MYPKLNKFIGEIGRKSGILPKSNIFFSLFRLILN
jgi:hypothetical protein